jgi:hypothetical protein
MTNLEDLVLVNALMRQALVAIEEVMGKNGLNAVLHTSRLDQYIDHLPPDDLEPALNASDYARLNEAIENFYGRGGRGILHRIGKASFEYGIREQPALFGLAGVALKMLPTKARIRFILSRMAGVVKKANPQLQIDIEETGMVQVRLTNYPQAICVSQLVCLGPMTAGDDLWVHDMMIYPGANARKLLWRRCRRIAAMVRSRAWRASTRCRAKRSMPWPPQAKRCWSSS